jgi:chromosome segregation ATPase
MDCERSDCKEVIAALRQRAEAAEKERDRLRDEWEAVGKMAGEAVEAHTIAEQEIVRLRGSLACEKSMRKDADGQLADLEAAAAKIAKGAQWVQQVVSGYVDVTTRVTKEEWDKFKDALAKEER